MSQAAQITLTEEEATLQELLLSMWLDSLEREGRGRWANTNEAKVFVMSGKGELVFVLGRTGENRLFLGVTPEVKDWFWELDWKYVMYRDGALWMCLRHEGDDTYLIEPVDESLRGHLPLTKGEIELAKIVPITPEKGEVVEYDRVRVKDVPFHNIDGGKQ